MGGGMMMQRPMYKKGGEAKTMFKRFNRKDLHESAQKARERNKKQDARKKEINEAAKKFKVGGGGKYKYGPHKVDVNRRATESLLGRGKIQEKIIKFADRFDAKQEEKRKNKKRVKKMAGGKIAGAARRAQEHGYYTPDMGMKGGKMFRDGGKVGKKKPRVKVIGIGKAKDYPGIKKIIEMNKKGKKRFKDGGSAMKPVDKSKNPGLAKLPTQVRNKMGYMKDGGKVKKPGGFDSTRQKGNIVHGKLKSQKELKKITSSDAYKKAGYHKKTEMLNRATHKDGGMASRRNTSRMNRLEELGRVDAERGFTRKGKRNLKAEKKRIVKELRK
jgi:hypothetical protein